MPSSTSYAPSEAAIAAAIERHISSSGFFQRVAEQLARGIYRDLADSLVPFGRRSDDKPVPGWPDAYLTKPDGALIAIEATTAGDARTNHWQADLAKLATRLAPERRGGLVWVAWCPASTPTDAAEMRDQACLLGLRREDVHIIFRRDLCARLRAPFYARFWINDLGLKVTSGPFSRVEDIITRVNLRRSTGIFPTAEEYKEDRVYVPPVLAKVERALADQRAAMVVGHGAAGKTTLAMVLAHRPRFRNAPTYYLDLTATADDPTLAERAGEVLIAIADDRVLFVIDNAHLNPEAAVRVFEQWKTLGGGSELLILTRRIRAKAEVWEDAPEIEAIPLPSFDLVIEPADLEGVYQRHYRAQNRDEVPPVPQYILARWHKLFGGDLLSFSAAVLGLLDRGGETAALEAADARVFVRNRYLTDPDLEPEQSALLDLAAVAEVEGLVPVEAFAENALKACVRRGLVWVETRGRKGSYSFYRLVHPGLGTLLREAADRAAASRDDRCRVLQAHPHACVVTALRLRNNGEITEATALLAALWRKIEWPLAAIGIPWWRDALRASVDMHLLNTEELSTRSSAWLNQAGARDALVKQALATLLHFLPSFLAYARTEMPDVAKVVRDALANNPAALVKQVLATPLHFLPSFLAYARAEMPDVAKVVRDALQNNPGALVNRALATPLGDLASFLAYARTEMPDVAKAVRDGLANNPGALVKQALATPLEHLAAFLAYARTEMPDIERAVLNSLLAEHLPTVADRAIHDGPGKLAALFKHDSAFAQTLPLIDAEAWSRRWGNVRHGQPNWFIRFASACYRSGRDVLVGPIAEAIIRTARLEDFPSPTITIRHLTFVLTSPHGCTPTEVEKFLARCVPPDWLAAQYRSLDAGVGALAGAVWSVVIDDREWLGRHFRHPALWQRVIAEQPANGHSPRHLAEWLQLFCAARLVDRPTIRLQPMDSRSLSDVLRVFPPGPPDEGIQRIQAALWAGLREWCHLSRERLIVDAELGNGILAQFRAADPGSRRLAAISAVMIEWLERCRHQDWRLVVDQDSLFDALERRLRVQDTGGRGATK
ncbi:MAG: hypothetical protein L6R19_09725 [Alphaproteobacteria bacterium]|nr:hypothetical protein [Alphaproteobacteria bacterium]